MALAMAFHRLVLPFSKEDFAPTPDLRAQGRRCFRETAVDIYIVWFIKISRRGPM